MVVLKNSVRNRRIVKSKRACGTKGWWAEPICYYGPPIAICSIIHHKLTALGQLSRVTPLTHRTKKNDHVELKVRTLYSSAKNIAAQTMAHDGDRTARVAFHLIFNLQPQLLCVLGDLPASYESRFAERVTVRWLELYSSLPRLARKARRIDPVTVGSEAWNAQNQQGLTRLGLTDINGKRRLDKSPFGYTRQGIAPNHPRRGRLSFI